MNINKNKKITEDKKKIMLHHEIRFHISTTYHPGLATHLFSVELGIINM
jgi:hypothetical protein